MRIPWPQTRAESIAARARAFVERGDVPFAFLPSAETDFIRYFSADAGAELAAAANAPFRLVSGQAGLAQAQVLIVTAHGSDLSGELWALREKAAEGVIVAVWLWDNHVLQLRNTRTAHAADLVFPSHAYAAHYLAGPAAVLSRHVAACTAQWTCAEAAQLFAARAAAPRRDRLLVNYVDYSFSWRGELLRRLAAEVPEADVLLMPETDRTRYFSKSPSERFDEWAQYKATVILPLERDLSTRVFDALLAGLVPVVPAMVLDFDRVVPPEVQEALGIVRIGEADVDSIRAGAVQALRNYDRLGPQGVTARHRYALEQHSLVNRVSAMLDVVLRIGSGDLTVGFTEGAYGTGLYLGPGG